MCACPLATDTLAIPSGTGWSGGPAWEGRFSLRSPAEGPGLLTQQTLAVAVGLGGNGHHILIVFGTYCVILEELKGTDQPLIEI